MQTPLPSEITLGAQAALQQQRADTQPRVHARDTPESIRASAEEYEGVFISQMLSHMFAGVSSGGPFGGGHSEETWRGIMVEEYGKLVAQSGGLGIADHVERELLRIQEAQSA